MTQIKARDLDHAIEIIKGLGAKRILFQVPDGLKPNVFEYFNKLSAEFKVVVSGEPFYGACDIGNFTRGYGVDCVLQLGHSVIPNIKYPLPVIFVEWRLKKKLDLSKISLDPLKEKNYKKVGLLASIQYIDLIDDVRKLLEENNLSAVIGQVDGRMAYPGQVLGCNFSAAHSVASEVDCYIVISTGMFHAIGVQLSSEKETFILDLNTQSLESVKGDMDRFLRKRYARISKTLDAKRFCVAVNTKIGQKRTDLAELVKNQLRELGKEAITVLTDDVKPSDFENMRCDAVVFTGCPRVSIDDQGKFTMPVLTPAEFQQLFGFRSAKKYVMDEIVNVSL